MRGGWNFKTGVMFAVGLFVGLFMLGALSGWFNS